jgi:hypothetical protein
MNDRYFIQQDSPQDAQPAGFRDATLKTCGEGHARPCSSALQYGPARTLTKLRYLAL